jgi:cytochrome b
MKRIMVWDVPTRLLHWVLTLTVLGALGLALLTGTRSPLFRIHMILGLVATFAVVLRVVWGFAGSRYARFSSFLVGPGALVEYLKGAFRRTNERRHVGHNPGAAYATFAMFGLTLALGVTGLLLATGNELVEEVHEPLALAFLALIAAHILGIVWHTIRHKDNIARSMVDGEKTGEPAEGIPSAHSIAGLAMLALTVAWAASLWSGYDAAAKQITLPLGGPTIHLGKVDDEGEGRRPGAAADDEAGERDKAGEHEDEAREGHKRTGRRDDDD